MVTKNERNLLLNIVCLFYENFSQTMVENQSFYDMMNMRVRRRSRFVVILYSRPFVALVMGDFFLKLVQYNGLKNVTRKDKLY